MNNQEKQALQYRFSGYQLPKIYLTAGFPSYEVPVHPYFYNQPLEWTKPAYIKYETTGPQLLGGEYPIQDEGYSRDSNEGSSSNGIEIAGSSGSSQAIIRGERSVKSDPSNVNMLPF